MSAATDAALIVPAAPGAVSTADALDDAAWFETYPHRRYRIRPGWVVRRRPPDVFLRVPLPPGHRYVDTETGAQAAWWNCAYPSLSPHERQAMAKDARRRSKPPAVGRKS
jgi:hypothetical protein